MGPRYPEVASIDAQLEAIGAKLNLEVRRIIAGMRSEVNATRGEVENLERQLAQLEERIARQAEAQVELADLEREAQASREVYGQFLERFNATLAQEAGQQPDARLVAPARPPLEPSGPRRKLLVAGAAVGAGGVGVLTALLLGFLRGGFGGPRPLEEATGLPVLEIVPELDRRQLRSCSARRRPELRARYAVWRSRCRRGWRLAAAACCSSPPRCPGKASRCWHWASAGRLP